MTSHFTVISNVLAAPIPFPNSGMLAQFHANASHSLTDVRILLEIGGQWYASAQNMNLAVGAQGRFTSTDPAILATNAQSHFLTQDAANWVSFQFSPGTSMGLGGALSSNLSGNITRLGFFTVQPAIAELSMVRMDALTLLEVPEPSRLLLFGIFLIVLGAKRCRL